MSYNYLIIEDSESYLHSIGKDVEECDELKILNNISFGTTSEFTPKSYIEKITQLTAKPDILFVDYELDWSGLDVTNGEELAKEIIGVYGPELPCIIFVSKPNTQQIKGLLYEYQFISNVFTQAIDKGEFHQPAINSTKTKLKHAVDRVIESLQNRKIINGETKLNKVYPYPDLKKESLLDLAATFTRKRKHAPISLCINNSNLGLIIFQSDYSVNLFTLLLIINNNIEKYLVEMDRKNVSHWKKIFDASGLNTEPYNRSVIYNPSYFKVNQYGEFGAVNSILQTKLYLSLLYEVKEIPNANPATHPYYHSIKKLLTM